MTSEPPVAGRGTAKLNPAFGETIIGIGVLVLAGVVYWQTTSIPVSPIYAKVGPTVVPYITAVCLGVLGLLLLVAASARRLAAGGREGGRAGLAWPWLWVAAGLVLNVLLIGPAGFTLASIAAVRLHRARVRIESDPARCGDRRRVRADRLFRLRQDARHQHRLGADRSTDR